MAPQVQEAIDQTETRATPLGSFPALFSQAMSLGTLSRRRVFFEAQSLLEGEGNSNAFSRLTGGNTTTTAKSARATADAADFHWHLARGDRLKDTRTGAAPRHWRWRVRYSPWYPTLLLCQSSTQRAARVFVIAYIPCVATGDTPVHQRCRLQS